MLPEIKVAGGASSGESSVVSPAVVAVALAWSCAVPCGVGSFPGKRSL